MTINEKLGPLSKILNIRFLLFFHGLHNVRFPLYSVIVIGFVTLALCFLLVCLLWLSQSVKTLYNHRKNVFDACVLPLVKPRGRELDFLHRILNYVYYQLSFFFCLVKVSAHYFSLVLFSSLLF